MGASSLSPSFGVGDGELSRGRSSHILHSMVKNNSALQLRLVMCGGVKAVLTRLSFQNMKMFHGKKL